MRTWSYLAATLVIGGCTLVGCNKDETPGQKIGGAVDATTQKAKDLAQQAQAAVSPTGANDLSGARNAIEGVTEKATSTNDFKDVASYFTKADEDRVVQSKPDTKDLDAQVEAFNKAWKDKYKSGFKIKDVNSAYPDSFLHIEQDSADPNKATGTVASSHGMPEVKVPFVREGALWKINIPADMDGPKLHANLLATLTTLNQGASTWPDSDVEASQAVTHAIMAAVMDKK